MLEKETSTISFNRIENTFTILSNIKQFEDTNKRRLIDKKKVLITLHNISSILKCPYHGSCLVNNKVKTT